MDSRNNKKQYYISGNKNGKRPNRQYFFTKSIKHQTVVMVISVIVVFLIMLGTSYAIFSAVNSSSDYNGIDVGDLHITYSDESGSVSLANSYPMSDVDGNNSQPYTFSIQNTGSLATTYSVKLLDDVALIDGEEKTDEEMVNKLLDKSDLKISVNGGTPTILENLSISNYEILNGTLQPGETRKISVRLWIKADASNNIFVKNADGSLTGKYYFGKITVNGENTKTYETDQMLMWLDAINNGEEGHSSSISSWYDLTGIQDYNMNHFSNYAWSNKALSFTGTTSIGTSYDVSNLNNYTISTAFAVKSIGNQTQFSIIDIPNLNIYLEGSNLKVGNLGESYSLDTDALYDVALVKKTKTEMVNEQETTVSHYEVYINGEFYQDVTNVTRENITAGSVNLDLYNYLVYSKALSLNKLNNNFVLTRTRYGA